MTFQNPIVGGNKLIRDAIQSSDYEPGVSGWSIERNGNAEFRNVTVQGEIVLTPGQVSGTELADGAVSGPKVADDAITSTKISAGAVTTGKVAAGVITGTELADGSVSSVKLDSAIQSTNYVPGTDGWRIEMDGTAEFNNVTVRGTIESSVVSAGEVQSSNYVAGSAGWRLAANGTAEFNGNLVTSLVDGKVHVGSLVDTTNSTVGSEVAVLSANAQNTPQIAGHAYRAIVQLSVGVSTANNRLRFRLWNGSLGGTMLGANAPIVRNSVTATFEQKCLVFVWRAPTTQTIANINVGMEFFSGSGNVQARVENSSYNFIIEDLGLASRIAGL